MLGLAKVGFVDPQQFCPWLLFALSLADIMGAADAISSSVAQGARYTEAHTEPSARTPASALRHGISTSHQLDPTHAVSTLDADMEGAVFLLRMAVAACTGLPPPPPPCLPSASHRHGYLRIFPTRPN